MADRFADVNYYVENYLCGNKEAIDTASFNFYADKASARIRSVINKEPQNIPDELKKCCCEVAEIIFKAEAKESGVSSESVGGWSRSFESTADTMQNTDKLIARTIKTWLCDTDLLYMGV